MFTSDNKQFAFFHIPKTAGGSITVLLSKYIDNNFNINTKNIDKSKKGWMTRYHIKSSIKSFNHMHSFVDPMFDKYGCKDLFSFAFVRNPYTRIVSLYKMLLPQLDNKSFLEFCNQLKTEDKKRLSFTQYDYISVNNKIPLSFIGRFENIENDFNFICEKINIPERYKDLGFEHKSEKTNYKDYYCNESKKIIDEVFDIDFKKFNYKKI